MKRTYLLAMIAAVLVVGLLLGAKKQANKWEYARLHFGQFNKWSWTAPDVSVNGQDVKELCKKLAIETPPDKAEAYTVVDWAGSQGWELTAVVRESQYSVGWFKRPK